MQGGRKGSGWSRGGRLSGRVGDKLGGQQVSRQQEEESASKQGQAKPTSSEGRSKKQAKASEFVTQ